MEAALALIIGITCVCLALTIYILKLKITYARKLFYFDLSRFAIHVFIVMPLIWPVLQYVSRFIFNPESATLPPPGVATVEQWLIWWLGMPLQEYTKTEGDLLALLPFVLRGQNPPNIAVYIALCIVLALDYLWAYRNTKSARTIRTINYGIMLLGLTLWHLMALTISPNIPGARDLLNRWLFMRYWHFAPWVVALIVSVTFFNFWLPMIVIGYLIYKSYK